MTSVEDVVRAKVTQFLTCDVISAIQQPTVSAAQKGRTFVATARLQPCIVVPGTVLTIESVVEYSPPEAKSSILCCQRFRTPLFPTKPGAVHVDCFDVTGRRLLFPLETRGVFYPVAFSEDAGENGADDCFDVRCLFRIKDIMERPSSGLCIQLVFSSQDVGARKLGIGSRLDLLDVLEEKSIVACRIGNGKKASKFIEFPSNCEVIFETVINWDAKHCDRLTASALKFCQEKIDAYKTEVQWMVGGAQINIDANKRWHSQCTENAQLSFSPKANAHLSLEMDRIRTRQEISGSIPLHFAPDAVANSNIGKHSTNSCSTNPMMQSTAVETTGNHIGSRLISENVNDASYDNAAFGEDGPSSTEVAVVHQSASRLAPTVSCDEHQKAVSTTTDIHLLTRYSPSSKLFSVKRHSAADKNPAINVVTEAGLSAYDEEGYLIPLQDRVSAGCTTLRHPADSASEDGAQSSGELTITSIRLRADELHGLAACTSSELSPLDHARARLVDMNLLASHVKESTARRLPLDNNATYDTARLQSFLEDSVAELHRQSSLDDENTGSVRSEAVAPISAKIKSRVRRSSEPWSGRHWLDEQQLLRSNHDISPSQERTFAAEGAYKEPDAPESETKSSLSLPLADMFQRPSSSGLGSVAPTHDSGHGTVFLDMPDWTERGDGMFAWTGREDGEGACMPTGELASWSVEEVAQALRYIGMGDDTVVRFSEERLDGRLLADLTDALLVEGFPDLNAWHRQKLVKFVHGWRPKRSSVSYI